MSIEILHKLIIEMLPVADADLLDLIYKLLLREC